MAPQTARIAIVIPVYNEAKNIERNIDAIAQGLNNSTDNFTIYIVYDFEEDSTLPVVARIRPKYSFEIKLLQNLSRGACQAIKTGLTKAEGDFVVVTMADMSDDYTILPAMITKAKEEGFDVVCGSRYMPGGKIHGGPVVKQNMSQLAGLSLRFLTGIPTHDVTNSYKLYRKSFLQQISIESEGGFEIGIELTAKAFKKGFRITEIPSQWWDRTSGQSRFQLIKWLPKYLRWYWYALL